ncbi:MAG: hypothetical protein K2X77_06925 [Candidatus Obscuribacterales bacterium]|jgi:hypothetical protein|nr:hypothetical protein [Candidatus Obscuribacterales bacterium]
MQRQQLTPVIQQNEFSASMCFWLPPESLDNLVEQINDLPGVIAVSKVSLLLLNIEHHESADTDELMSMVAGIEGIGTISRSSYKLKL